MLSIPNWPDSAFHDLKDADSQQFREILLNV